MSGMRRSRAALLLVPLAAAACGGTAKHATTTPRPQLESKAYRASVDYARCMRQHGIAHPNPDANGDFHLTPAQERRMRASSTPAQHEAADKVCFKYLKGVVSTKPLSKKAQAAALVPLRELKACLHGKGYEVGTPIVKPMSRGRAMFGFSSSPQPPRSAHARALLQQAQHTCEQRVKLAQRIDAIIKLDRGEGY
jgi:hypothetical protein